MKTLIGLIGNSKKHEERSLFGGESGMFGRMKNLKNANSVIAIRFNLLPFNRKNTTAINKFNSD